MNTHVIGSKALIALGSNEESVWGDAKATVLRAIQSLEKLSIGAVSASKLYATPAFPAGAGPDFVNAAVVLETSRDPADLLAQLHKIEAEAGRVRKARWGQRTLDLDLVAFGDAVLPDLNTYVYWRDLPLAAQTAQAPDALILPHPRVQDRGFVLIPLSDVAADWRHPVSGLSVAQMCAGLSQDARAQVRVISPS